MQRGHFSSTVEVEREETDAMKKTEWQIGHIDVWMRTAAFLLPVFVMLASFHVSGIRPFGDEYFQYMDFYHQYVPFFTEFIRVIRGGDGIFYSWNAGVGSDFYVLYGYYLASPLNWLGVLISERYLGDFLAYSVVVKTGLCGLTVYCYLDARSRRMEQNSRGGQSSQLGGIEIILAMGYALSGFMMAYNWNVMWLDGVILLPVILLGLERLVQGEKPFLYCLALAASIWSNFYISIMICIFVVLYFVVLWAEIRSAKVVRNFVVFSLLAGGVAAALLIPEICALLATDFGKGETAESLEQYFPVLDVLFRHCMGIVPQHIENHWPNVYCGVSAFLFVPLFVFQEKIPMRRRFGMLALLGFMLLSFSTPVLDLFWHGLNFPDQLPARQSFLYCMLVILICHEGAMRMNFNDPEQKRSVFHAYLLGTVMLLLAEKFGEDSGITTKAVFETFLFLTVYAILLYLVFVHKDNHIRACLIALAIGTVVLETQINTVDTNLCILPVNRYWNPEICQQLYEETASQDQGIYRYEMFDRTLYNEGMRDHYASASLFSSTQNSKVKDLYGRLGMRSNKVFYGFEGNTPFTAALLNVKYMIGRENTYPKALYTFERQEGEVCLYRINAVLPFGYVASVGYDLPERESALALQNKLAEQLGAEGVLFEKCEVTETENGVAFTIPRDGIYYAVLLTGDGVKRVSMSGTNAYGTGWNNAYLSQNSVIYLGELPAGREGSLTGADAYGKDKKAVLEVYRLNEEMLSLVIAALSAQHLENVQYDSTHVSGSLHLEQEGRLILSVPYEKGWKVFLNGERVEPATFGGALIALDLQPGDYELAMEYVPYGFWGGVLVSVLSIVTVAVLYFLDRRKRRGEELAFAK